MKKIKSILALTGIIGACFYLAHILLGGILWKSYHQLLQPISDLTATGAPDRVFLLNLTFAYSACMIIFSLLLVYCCSRNFGRTAIIGAYAFLALHVVSLLYGFFPEDLPGAAASFEGTMHIIITVLIVPLTIASPLFLGKAFLQEPGYRQVGRLSITAGISIFILGGITAFFYARQLPYFGLVERLNVGVLQAWTVLLSVTLYNAYRTGLAE